MCQTAEERKYYLWGSNRFNECLKMKSDEESVTLPFCINDMVSKKTKGQNIDGIQLG